MPPQGAWGTIVSATGSGKTFTAAECLLECFPGGRILMTVPPLDLLVQTAQVSRAVCSPENDPVLNELGVRTTDNPIQLALRAGHGPVVVFAPYASLVDREDPEGPTGWREVRGPRVSSPRSAGQMPKSAAGRPSAAQASRMICSSAGSM